MTHGLTAGAKALCLLIVTIVTFSGMIAISDLSNAETTNMDTMNDTTTSTDVTETDTTTDVTDPDKITEPSTETTDPIETIETEPETTQYKEVFDPASKDIKGYIRLTGQLGGLNQTGMNLMASVDIEPGTEYKVSCDADTRFRVGTLNSNDLINDLFLERFFVSPLDNNDMAIIGEAECTITSGSDHDLLLIQYYTSTGTADPAVTRSTISVQTVVKETTDQTTEPSTDPETPDDDKGTIVVEYQDNSTRNVLIAFFGITAGLLIACVYLRWE